MLERATRTDFNNYLVEDILVKTDRASMLNSLELRAPFLSREIMEFAFTLKNDYKTNIFERKIILKMLSKKVLPSDFNSSRKQGFAIPLNHWLKSKLWLDFFKDVLLEKNSLFNQKYLDNLFTLQEKNKNLGERLFALVMFKLWAKEYNISFEK